MRFQFSFHWVLIGAVAIGLAIGAAFGAGIAYGRGNPKVVQAQSTQQIQAQLGLTGASNSLGQGAGGSGAAGGLNGRLASGRVTAVDGQTVTIETRQGSEKINLGPTTTVSRLTPATAADLKEGMTITATGQRKADGSFDATSVSEVTGDLQGLAGGGAGGAGQSVTPSAGQQGR